MDDETLNQESQNEGAPLPEDALTDEERARVGLPLADPPQDGNFSRQQNAADRAIDHYCAVCGIELSSNDANGCVPGKCVMRPVPERSFDPERARREREHKIEK